MILKEDAIEIARQHLSELEIETIKLKSTRKIDGSVRAAVLSEELSDFWLVTFERSTKVVGDTSRLTQDQIKILTAIALENDTVTVRVEMSGNAEVI